LSKIPLGSQQGLAVPEKPTLTVLVATEEVKHVDSLTRLAEIAMEMAQKYGKMSS
jgi:hypothetical protein